eukprot:TRINITY_DN26827_c0_g1_i1.p1 TRINITY_DN26827_c0_g1~~TRINITY_DN26827_c0_g1_i1.p1  ORF type:complete len:164 (+),score=9.37 TRINITY_DN26827_c0_g1_i1:54-494(+)
MEPEPRSKRGNPFAEECYRTSKSVKNDLESIYEKTLKMLMGGFSDASANPHKDASTFDIGSECCAGARLGSCDVCSKQRDVIPCSYCGHAVCELCVRQCEKCHDIFCTFCSTVNYHTKRERVFCLCCNSEAEADPSRLRQPHGPSF